MSELQLLDSLYETWYNNENEFPIGGTTSEQLEFLLKYAVLAPSSHNSQPWLFVVRHGVLTLFADRTRALPVVDPEDRELTISCGAALFFLRVAIRHFGYEDVVHVCPDPFNSDLLAHVELGERRSPTPEDESLFYAIFRRHTNREPFEDREVPCGVIAELQKAAGKEGARLSILEGEERRNAVGDLVSLADREQWSDPEFRRELAAWVHANRGLSGDGMPAYAFGIGDLASIAAPLVVRTFDMGNGRAANDRQLVSGSPLLAMLTTVHDRSPDWLAAGQALASVLLHAISYEVSASFLNQPIEIVDLRPRLANLVGIDGYPQILLRLGYGPPPRLTPRRPVEEVLR